MDGCYPLQESLDKFLNRSQLPNDVEALKDIVVSMASSFSEQLEYLNGQLCILKRFQYGQRSERLKKKRLK